MFPGWVRRQDAPLDEPYPDGSPMGCRGAALGPGCCRAAALNPHHGAEDVGLLQSPHCRGHPSPTAATAPSAPQQGPCSVGLRMQPELRCLFPAVATGRCTDSVHNRTLHGMPDTAWNAGHCLHSRTLRGMPDTARNTGHCMHACQAAPKHPQAGL